MKTQMQHLLIELKALSLIEENLPEFEKILTRISEFNDSSVINTLLSLLDDYAQSDNAMFEIIHYVESFDDEIYALEVFKSIEETYEKAPHWACLLVIRIINNDSCSKIFNNLVSQFGLNSSFAKKLCASLIADFPQMVDKIKSTSMCLV